MKKTSFLSLLLFVVLFYSCSKQEDYVAPVEPTAVPNILKYNVVNRTVSFVSNNNYPNDTLIGFDGSYSIRLIHSYDMGNGPQQNFAYGFTQHDSGFIQLGGGNGTLYAVIRIHHLDLEGYHLEFKAGLGYSDFTVSPAILGDTNTFFMVKSKFNSRTMRIDAKEFIKQEDFIFFYDKN